MPASARAAASTNEDSAAPIGCPLAGAALPVEEHVLHRRDDPPRLRALPAPPLLVVSRGPPRPRMTGAWDGPRPRPRRRRSSTARAPPSTRCSTGSCAPILPPSSAPYARTTIAGSRPSSSRSSATSSRAVFAARASRGFAATRVTPPSLVFGAPSWMTPSSAANPIAAEGSPSSLIQPTRPFIPTMTLTGTVVCVRGRVSGWEALALARTEWLASRTGSPGVAQPVATTERFSEYGSGTATDDLVPVVLMSRITWSGAQDGDASRGNLEVMQHRFHPPRMGG